MHDFISIGSTPPDENCSQLGSPDYDEQSRRECLEYINLLRRHFGNEPVWGMLRVKSFPHDFGTYREVVCYYSNEDEETTNYAFRCESEGPVEWDNESRAVLGLTGEERNPTND